MDDLPPGIVSYCIPSVAASAQTSPENRSTRQGKRCPETKGVGSALALGSYHSYTRNIYDDMMDRRNSARRSNRDVNNSIVYIQVAPPLDYFFFHKYSSFPPVLLGTILVLFLQATCPKDSRWVGLRRGFGLRSFLGGDFDSGLGRWVVMCLVARLMWMFAGLGATGELRYGGCGGRAVGGGGGGDVVGMVWLFGRLVSRFLV